MYRRFKRVGLGAACALALASPAAAVTVYDALADFGSTNPSGAWSYGEGVLGSTFLPLPRFSTSCYSIANFSCYQSPTPAQGDVPVVLKNGTGSAVFFAGTVVSPTDVLLLHPAPSSDAILRFTAPTTADYAYSGFFQALDTSPTGVTLYVGGGATTFVGAAANAGTLTGGGTSAFSGTVHLLAGQVFDFGVGPSGDYHHDSTGLSVTLTEVVPTTPGIPEPGVWALMLLGFGSAGAMLRRRRRAFA
jgi:hypothetical protein